MTQFIDIETIKAVVLLFFALGLLIFSFRFNANKKEKQSATKKRNYEKYYWLGYIILLTLIPLIDAYNTKAKAEVNIKSFRGAKILRCITNPNEYSVSKKEGWQIDQYFFVKDSLMIRADKCKRISR